MPPTYLVTGAAGFIGSHLVERLLTKGISVVGIDNFDPFYPIEIKKDNLKSIKQTAKSTGTAFDFVKKDLVKIDRDLFRKVKIDAVFHLAAKAGVRPSIEAPFEYLHTNVEGTMRLLEFCRERKINDFIFGSSSSVYGDDTPIPFREDARSDKPISPYAATKRMGELYCHNFARLYNLRVAALRFFTVYGPRQRPDLAIHKFSRAIMRGKKVEMFGDGSTSRDYTFVSDIVDGVLASLDWLKLQSSPTFEIFNLGGSAPVTLRALLVALEKEIGKKAEVKWGKSQPGDVVRTYADISKSTKLLGYRPRVPLAVGLKEFVRWVQSSP